MARVRVCGAATSSELGGVWTHLLTPIPPPGPRGYEPKYRMLESAIKKLAPTAAVTGKTGRVSSFEVVVDGTVVYSKLATGAFPDFTKLAAQIAQ